MSQIIALALSTLLSILSSFLKMNAEQFAQFMNKPRTRRPESFESGEGTEWLTWRRNFELLVPLNQWDGGGDHDERLRRRTRAKREARTSIKGRADQMVADIQPLEDNETIAAFLDRLQRRYLPTAESNYAKVAFELAAQLPTESLLDWCGRVRQLFSRAQPNDAGGANNNNTLIRRFILGITNPIVKTHVLDHTPATLDAALDLAQNKAATEATVAGTIGPNSKIASLGAPTEFGLVNAVNDGTATPSTTQATAALRRRGMFPNSGIVREPRCWGCNSADHFLSDCPNARNGTNAMGRGGGRGSWGRGRGARGRRGRGGRGRGRPRQVRFAGVNSVQPQVATESEQPSIEWQPVWKHGEDDEITALAKGLDEELQLKP